MLEIRSKLTVRRDAYKVEVRATLRLPFEARQKSRLRARLASGEEVALVLARGEWLRGGDLLVASDGRVIEVVAEPERVLHVVCTSPAALVRAAYHLGNRHVPVEVGDGYLRLAADHVLEEMLKGLGASLEAIEAPFEPVAGAYAGEHRHGDEPAPGARIHEHGAAHDHDHDHPHHGYSHHDHPGYGHRGQA